MKTPKEYSENLKNNVLTRNMLIDCLFSVNKRAKNCRDKEREYRNKIGKYYYDKYDTEEKYREKKEEYYSQKEKILKLFTPNCIHKEIQNKHDRIYSYEPEYEYYYDNCKYIYEGNYYDKDMHEVVYFVDVLIPKEKYYLFYDMGECSFHTPICEQNIEFYSNLEIKEIGTLLTHGKQVQELVSIQFIKKVIDLIDSGKYIYEIFV